MIQFVLLFILWSVPLSVGQDDVAFAKIEGEWIEINYLETLKKTRSPRSALNDSINPFLAKSFGLTALSIRRNQEDEPEIMCIYGMHDSAPLGSHNLKRLNGDTLALTDADGNLSTIRLVYSEKLRGAGANGIELQKELYILNLFEQAPVICFIFCGKDTTGKASILETEIAHHVLNGQYINDKGKPCEFRVKQRYVLWNGNENYSIGDWSIDAMESECDWVDIVPDSLYASVRKQKKSAKKRTPKEHRYAFRWNKEHLYFYATKEIGGVVMATDEVIAKLTPVEKR